MPKTGALQVVFCGIFNHFQPRGRLHAEQRFQLDALQHDAPALPLPHVSRADGRGANGHLTDVQVLADDHGALEGVGLVRLVLLWRSGDPKMGRLTWIDMDLGHTIAI